MPRGSGGAPLDGAAHGGDLRARALAGLGDLGHGLDELAAKVVLSPKDGPRVLVFRDKYCLIPGKIEANRVGGPVTVIVVANLKGGTGKTTIAVNLACSLSRSRDVLLVDADQQGTAIAWAEPEGLPIEVRPLPLENPRGAQGWRQKVLNEARSFTVVVDCPPHLQGATQAAIDIADLVLVPVTPSRADILATSRAVEMVKAARGRKARPLCVLVPSKVDLRTTVGWELPSDLKELGEPVGPAIRQLTAHIEAFEVGSWVGDYALGSPAHADIASLTRSVSRRLA